MSAVLVHALIDRQRVRNRIFIAVAAAAALLDIGIVVVIAADLSRSVRGVAIALVVMAVIMGVSVVAAVGAVGGARSHSETAPADDWLVSVVATTAERLRMEPPEVRITGDDTINAFSYGTHDRAQLFYTKGFHEAFRAAEDRPLAEAVTAHLLVRIAAGDNTVTVVAAGLLNWALFLFNKMIRPLAKHMRWFGRAYMNPDYQAKPKPSGTVYGDDMFNRFLMWAIQVAIGLALLAVSLVVLVLGGVLAVVAGGVRLGLVRQRIRVADAIAAELTGDPRDLATVLARLDGAPLKLAYGGECVADLRFAGYSFFFPDLPVRATQVMAPGETITPGWLAPLASALAVTLIVGGTAVLADRIPYGHPLTGTANASSAGFSSSTAPDSGGGGQSASVPTQPDQSGLAPSGSQPSAGPTDSLATTPTQSPTITPTSGPPTQSGQLQSPPQQSPSPPPSPSPSPSPSPQTTTVQLTIPAKGWTDTGIQVSQGDVVTVSASGSWTADGVHYAGPDGYSALSADNFFNVQDLGVCSVCAKTLTGHWAELISYTGPAPPSVGSYTSTAIAPETKLITVVGSQFSGPSQYSGELWLGFNDDAYSAYTVDNAGQVTATVTVTRQE